MAHNVMSLFYRVILVYVEPLVFSILGVIPIITDPATFQAGHAPTNFSPSFLTLANKVTLFQYGALLLVVGFAAFLVMATALQLDDPTGKSQRRILKAMQSALLLGDVCFASASIVPYYEAGMADYLNPFKVLTGQVPLILNPFLGVWLSAALSVMRISWLVGSWKQPVDKKVQ